MSIFGDRAAQGSFEDARRPQSLSQRGAALQACGTCKRDIFPPNSLPGLGYYRENYCQCVKAQEPQDRA
jgi:hypothetical protein